MTLAIASLTLLVLITGVVALQGIRQVLDSIRDALTASKDRP